MVGDARESHEEQAVVRERYAAERAKRLRPDPDSQYRVAPEELVADPWSTPQPRDPVSDHVTFTFIGGGWSGVITAALLRQAGVHDVRIVDVGGDFGGVWYWNRYPGIMCDSPSIIYLPFLEETGHLPTEKYVHGPEIRDQFHRVAEHFGLYERALFHTRVVETRWQDDAQNWQVTTDRGDVFTTAFLGIGPGALNIPKVPDIPGITEFEGHTFHTSRWDYAYTGGDDRGRPMDKLRDKRIAVIGSGATAIQVVPELAEAAGKLYVVQRTPSSVDERHNGPLGDWTPQDTSPGWQQRYQDNYIFNWDGVYGRPYEDVDVDNLMPGDGFVSIPRRVRDAMRSVPLEERTPERIGEVLEQSDFDHMGRLRARIDQIVQDPETADKLKPWYGLMCKRPTWHDGYLPAFNNPSTQLIDTDGRGVERITPRGFVVDGVEYEVDCIVWATGFVFSGFDTIRGIDYPVLGRGGRTLADHWSDGMRTLHGIQVHGFPNMFVAQLAQGVFFGPNATTNCLEVGKSIVAVVADAVSHGYGSVEPTAEAEESWVQMILRDTVRVPNTCPPGYYNFEGKEPGRYEELLVGYPQGSLPFLTYVRAWEATGDFVGLERRPRNELAQPAAAASSSTRPA